MPYGSYGYAQIFILQICHMGRLMPKFLYLKYAIWADSCQFLYFKYALWADLWLCPNFYTANMLFGQTYAQIFILQICLFGNRGYP